MGINKCRGQALLEAVLALPCTLLIFFVLIAIVYLGFARAWIGYQSDQALFCLAEGESQFHCRRMIEKSVQRFLPFGELRRVQLDSFNDQWRATIDWQWTQFHIKRQKILKWDSSTWRS